MKPYPAAKLNSTKGFFYILSHLTWKRLVLYTLAASALIGGVTLGGCATNPATGERQLSLYSEAQEIEIGKEADEDISGSLGIYTHKDLNKYVERLGKELAEKSERPQLPWAFRIVDDPTVNAFALPTPG